jgi:hypothetical protein
MIRKALLVCSAFSMEAGKDVYVETVSRNIQEGRRVLQVARKLGGKA